MLKSSLNTSDPNHIYYDLQIINNDTTGTKAPVKLEFNETRNSPFLSVPSDYYISVIRFNIDTGNSLPVFIPYSKIGQSDVNKLIYTVTMTYKVGANVVQYQQNLNFVPQNLAAPIPPAPTEFQYLESDYYFIYSFSHWINKIVNKALSDCYDGLNTAVIAAGGVLPTINKPFFVWDDATGIAKLYAPKVGFDNDTLASIGIYMNSPLFNLFSSTEALYLGYNNITFGKNYAINVYNKNNTNIQTINGVDYYIMGQEYSCGPLYSPISSLVFSTGLIPVAPSMSSIPKVFNSEAGLFSNGNNSNIENIITDFEIGLSKGTEWRPNVSYAPSAEYRLFDLYGNNPLNTVQINCYWKDDFGGLHPFYLGSGCAADIKIMFRKKNVMD